MFKNFYHGSGKLFDEFNQDYIGTGTESSKFGMGFYLTSSPKVADEYREDLSKLSSSDTASFVKYSDGEIAYNGVHNDEEIDFLNGMEEEVLTRSGGLYEVRVSSSAGIVNSKDFFDKSTAFELVQSLYDTDEFDAIYDKAIAMHVGSDYSVDEDIQNLFLIPHFELSDEFDFSDGAGRDLIKMMKYRLELDSENSNEDLINSFKDLVGNEERSAQIMNSCGIQGILHKNEASVYSGEISDYMVVWDAEVLTIMNQLYSPESVMSNDFDSSYDY